MILPVRSPLWIRGNNEKAGGRRAASRKRAADPGGLRYVKNLVDGDELVLRVAHPEFGHGRELAQAVAALDSLNEVVIVLLGHAEDEVAGGLVDSQDVGRGQNADVRNGRFSRAPAGAVTVDGHAAQHVQEDDVLAEVVAGGLA